MSFVVKVGVYSCVRGRRRKGRETGIRERGARGKGEGGRESPFASPFDPLPRGLFFFNNTNTKYKLLANEGTREQKQCSWHSQHHFFLMETCKNKSLVWVVRFYLEAEKKSCYYNNIASNAWEKEENKENLLQQAQIKRFVSHAWWQWRFAVLGSLLVNLSVWNWIFVSYMETSDHDFLFSLISNINSRHFSHVHW